MGIGSLCIVRVVILKRIDFTGKLHTLILWQIRLLFLVEVTPVFNHGAYALLHLIPVQRYRIVPGITGRLIFPREFDALGAVGFVISGYSKSALAVFFTQKGHALLRVVALQKIGVNTDFSLTDTTATLKQVFDLVLRYKTASNGFDTLQSMELFYRFVHLPEPRK